MDGSQKVAVALAPTPSTQVCVHPGPACLALAHCPSNRRQLGCGPGDTCAACNHRRCHCNAPRPLPSLSRRRATRPVYHIWPAQLLHPRRTPRPPASGTAARARSEASRLDRVRPGHEICSPRGDGATCVAPERPACMSACALEYLELLPPRLVSLAMPQIQSTPIHSWGQRAQPSVIGQRVRIYTTAPRSSWL
jgi:hypothetical protein